jgi:regulator of CtrA degradation
MGTGITNAPDKGVTVSFGERFAASEQFNQIFKEGMALVERTAVFLDGPGRSEAKRLRPPLTLVYATESMRLTSRLLELASWLLIGRALNEGEISVAEARQKRQRLKLQALGRPSHVKRFSELPKGLQQLIEASFALNDRIVQLDRAMRVQLPAALDAASNPVEAQVARLERAFAAQSACGVRGPVSDPTSRR